MSNNTKVTQEMINQEWEEFESYLVKTRYAERDEKTKEPIENNYDEILNNRIIPYLNEIINDTTLNTIKMVRERDNPAYQINKVVRSYFSATDHGMNRLQDIIKSLKNRNFITASPFIMSFGNEQTQRAGLYSCYPLGPVPDSMEGIYDFCNKMRRIYMFGGGAGVDFSEMRPENSQVDNGQGIASGPCGFVPLFESITGTTNQGGRRRGALLGQLNWDHPDIRKFISLKSLSGVMSQFIATLPSNQRPAQNPILSNINISINTDEGFFEDEDLLTFTAQNMWASGDPGILFKENAVKYSPFRKEDSPWYSNPCVVGDTLLRTPKGDFKIKNLVSKGITEIPVYCCDPKTGNIEIRMGRNPRKTGIKKKVYKVTYTTSPGNTDFIIVTSNHKFLDNECQEIECKDLKPGQSLKYFGKRTHKIGSKGKKENNFRTDEVVVWTNGWNNRKESHLVAEWKYGKTFDFGRKPDQYSVHHINGNHTDNSVENIEVLTNVEHLSLHSSGENNPMYGRTHSNLSKKRMSESAKDWRREQGIIYEAECDWCGDNYETSKAYNTSGHFCSEECRQSFKENKKKKEDRAKRKSLKHECPFCGKVIYTTNVTCGSKKCVNKSHTNSSNYEGASDDRRRAAIESTKSKSLSLASSLLNENYDIKTPEKWDKVYRSDLKTFTGKKRTKADIIQKYFPSWNSFLNKAAKYNHKVVSVEFYGYEDVYNITVDDFHTVAWNSLITKNCGEFLSKAGINCNLLTVNVAKLAHENFYSETFTDESFLEKFLKSVYQQSYLACLLGNIILTCDNGFPLDEIRFESQKYRPVGVGMSGLHTALIFAFRGKEDSIYGSKSAVKFARQTQLMIALGSMAASVEIGRYALNSVKYVSEDNYTLPESNMDYWKRHFNELKQEIEELKEDLNIGDFANSCDLSLERIIEFVYEYKSLFNFVTTSQAPTGSISTFLRNIDTGIEPCFGLEIERRVRDFGNNWKTLNLHHYFLWEFCDKNPAIKEFVEQQCNTLPTPVQQLDMLEAIVRYCHTGVSKTVSVPEETTVEDIKKIIIDAKNRRLKGFTVFRNGSRESIVINKQNQCKDNTTIIQELHDNNVDDAPVEDIPWRRTGETFEVRGPISAYIRVNVDSKNRIRECFVDAGDTGTMANALLAAIGRLLSVGLRRYPDLLPYYINTLSRIQIGDRYIGGDAGNGGIIANSLPHMVSKILQLKQEELMLENIIKDDVPISTEEIEKQVVINKPRKELLDICPNCCELTFKREGGCRSCKNCGFSQC